MSQHMVAVPAVDGQCPFVAGWPGFASLEAVVFYVVDGFEHQESHDGSRQEVERREPSE